MLRRILSGKSNPKLKKESNEDGKKKNWRGTRGRAWTSNPGVVVATSWKTVRAGFVRGGGATQRVPGAGEGLPSFHIPECTRKELELHGQGFEPP